MARRGPGGAGAARLLVVVAALCAGLALDAGAVLGAAPQKPVLELVVEPLHPIQGTRAEIVAQVKPASFGRHGTATARIAAPGGGTTPVAVQRVQGATPGTFEGLAPVQQTGTYRVTMRFSGGGQVLTATRTFVVVKGSPYAHDLSLVIVVVVLGGAWLLMRRRR